MSDERNLKTAWVHHYGSTHGYDKAIAEVRQAALVEAAEWLRAQSAFGLSSGDYGTRMIALILDGYADQVRTLPQQAPQGRAGTRQHEAQR